MSNSAESYSNNKLVAFAQWKRVAEEYTQGKKTFIEFAEKTAQTEEELFSTRTKESDRVPLTNVIAVAKAAYPDDYIDRILINDSLEEGRNRISGSAVCILEFAQSSRWIGPATSGALLENVGRKVSVNASAAKEAARLAAS